MNVWNVCLEHHHRYAGMHRAVEDFARACGGPIMSFDATAADDSVDPAGRVHVVGVKGWPPDGPYWLSRAQASTAAQLLREADGVVVHSLFRAHCGFIAGWARGHGKPFWIVPHGCLDPWGLARRRLAKRIWLAMAGRRAFAGCAGLIFSTTRERDKAAAWIGRARTLVTAWPVDPPGEAEHGRLRAGFRERYRIPADARLLLSVGRLHSMKRPRELIDAFDAAGAPNCHLVMVGMDGNITAAALRRQALALGASRVHVVGPLYGDDLTASLAAADGFMSLSHRENFGYAVADALAAGLPVMLTPGHDLAHDVPLGPNDPSACGWMVAGDPVASARDAIRTFAALSAQDLHRRGAAARAWASEHLGRDRFERALRAEIAAGVASATPRAGGCRRRHRSSKK
jgi:glycosyltransferase involved in cell wall biosynthesis